MSTATTIGSTLPPVQITDDKICADHTTCVARRLGGTAPDSWRVGWLPDRIAFSRQQAISAIQLAEAVSRGTDSLYPVQAELERLAADVGISLLDAIHTLTWIPPYILGLGTLECPCAAAPATCPTGFDITIATKPALKRTVAQEIKYYRWAAHRLRIDVDRCAADTHPNIIARWRYLAGDFEAMADQCAIDALSH